METKYTFPIISYDQYLSEVLDHIPTNTILSKVIPGLGATSMEIEDQSRNSIIVEPNVPVIIGKEGKYNKHGTLVRGVYEGITIEQITDYIESSVTPKKIITTPESYLKVKEALKELKVDMYKDYFMLFDECERTIQDVSYRSKILLPIDDFFLFDNKAFISATPIKPSDKRFNKNNFQYLEVEPDYDYSERLHLIHTNNVFITVKKYLAKNLKDQYFFFFNSTDTIAYLIRYLNIEQETAIYCAKESMQKLKANQFKNVSTSLGKFKKYNFLTSRFFSAVDIEGITDPTIIMITDIVSAEHSMIDPASEAVQIIGRFRRKKGDVMIKNITHITNTNPNLLSKSEAEVLRYIKEWQGVYKVLNNYLKASTTNEAREVLREVIIRIDFARYLNKDGTKNMFMVDNTIFEEKVKGYYQTLENLSSAYKLTNRFHITHEEEKHAFTDKDKLKANKNAPLKTVFEVVMPKIQELHDPEKSSMYEKAIGMEFLNQEFPKVVQAFNMIGLSEAKRLKFNPKKIQKAIKEKESNNEKTNFGFMAFIENNFIEKEYYSSTSIKSILKTGLDANKLVQLKPGVKLLKQYCKLSKRQWIGTDEFGKDVMGYQILEISNKYKK